MIPTNVLSILQSINPNIQNIQNVSSPDELAQMLLNSGSVNQMQVNQAKQLWNQPNIRQMIQSRYKY